MGRRSSNQRDKYEEKLYKMLHYLEEMPITYIDDDELHISAEKEVDEVYASLPSIDGEFEEYEERTKVYKKLNLKPCVFKTKFIPTYEARCYLELNVT